MTSSKIVAAALFALVIARPGPASADDNPSPDYLVGDRAVGLGGAFTAISDDSSGAFYNPAGLAEAARSSVSLSASVYGLANNSWAVEEIHFESENNSFITYPTTAAWIQRVRQGGEDGVGRVQLALSLITPRSNINRKRLHNQEVNIPQSGWATPTNVDILSVINLVTEDDTLWVGISAAWKVLRRLSLGVSVFLSYRSAIYQEQQLVVARFYSYKTGKEITRLGLGQMSTAELTHLALLGVIGVMVPVTDHFKIGASFRSPGIELYGNADFKAFGTAYSLANKKLIIEEELFEGITFHSKEPLKGTLGLAYVVPFIWGAALDFSIYGPVADYPLFEDEAHPKLADVMRMKKKLIWQLDLGGEYYILGKVPVRAGFFTNLSSFDPVELCGPLGNCIESNFFNDTVDMYGVSASVGYEVDHVALNLGASYSFGSSKSTVSYETALGRAVSQEVEQSRSYLFITIGGAFRF